MKHGQQQQAKKIIFVFLAEVLLKEGELQCLLDERNDCDHVGFVYSLPELYNMNDEIKVPPRSAYGEVS